MRIFASWRTKGKDQLVISKRGRRHLQSSRLG